jgi:hypothetical protein
MGTELIELEVQPRPQPETAEGSLTWRASLNLLQSVLDYSAKLGVGLVVVPILVSGLGRTVFGVWEMLGRLMGYLESTDGRPTQALRLVISNLQSQRDPHVKRRWIGAALMVWLCFLPLWSTARVAGTRRHQGERWLYRDRSSGLRGHDGGGAARGARVAAGISAPRDEPRL